MNSRSSVNESNLVNFSADLTTLNPLDTKDTLLSFPFDHIYACHSETDRRQTLDLDKEVEISTHCVVAEDKDIVVSSNTEISQLNERLETLENQNQRLKEFLLFHLDLIQQQNELLTKRDKLYQALKKENDTLKSKLNRLDRRITVNPRHSLNPPPLVHVPPTSTVTSSIVESEPSASSQILLNSFTEFLLPDSRANSLIFDSDLNKNKTFGQDSFELPTNTETDVTSFLPDLGVSSILDSNLNCDEYTMIENKRSFVKKEVKTEPRSEALYTVTSNSGNPVIQRIQRNRRKTSGLGSLSRMSKSSSTKTEPSDTSKVFADDKGFERSFSVNKKSKMINTYGKSRLSSLKRTSQFTGSLSDRLQLIDTTPTGEDPYQLGEADMREQSPIPKLMLQKTNHGRMKLCTDTGGTSSTRHFYGTSLSETNTKATNKVKSERFNLSSTYMHTPDIKTEIQKPLMPQESLVVKPESGIDWRLFDVRNVTKSPKTLMVDDPDLDLVKTEPEIDWRMYNPNKPGNETSLCDFSYGETPNNLGTHNIIPSLDSVQFQDLFQTDSPLHLESLAAEYAIPNEKSNSDKSKKRGARTTSLIGHNYIADAAAEAKRASAESKRVRKRALSTTGLAKNLKRESLPKGVAQKPKLIKGKEKNSTAASACRGKKSPMPGMVTTKPYHTLVGDPDLSWYLGLDPDVKLEDIDPTAESEASQVEVPRWREKPYTSCYTLEGTENLDDKVFEKRHQKLEAEERRQLRWHMRRIREQRHVERLRQRQRDSWCAGGSPAHAHPAVFTVWQQPQRDLRYIEITDELPVTAFGEILPALPESDFMLPWVRSSKAMKRSKRSKTLH